MNRFFRYGLHCSWYCWGLLILALLNFEPVGNLLSSKFGENLFLYTLYMSPVILMWLSMFLHGLGLSSSISIILMISYLVYHGSFITIEAWEFFKPIFQTCDVFYIWDAIIIQSVNSMVYLFSGIFCLTSAVGGVIYLFKNKDSFTFSIDTKKVRKKPQHKNPYGSATLATPKNIKKIADKDGFVIGLMPKSPVDTYDIDKSKLKLIKNACGKLIKLPIVHTIMIAASRVGKGSGVIIPNILDHNGGVLVLDPKPEIVHITKRHRESKGQKVFVFDPENRSNLANCNINVLDFLDHSDQDVLHQQIIDLTEMLCPAPANATDATMHFIEGGRNCLEFMLLFMINAIVPKDEMHLGTLYDMLTMSNKEFLEALESASNSEASGGALARAANTIITTSGNEVSGVINTARRAVNFSKSPYNRKAISKSNIKLEDFCIDTNDFYICTKITIDNKPNKLTQFLTTYIFSAIRAEKEDSKKSEKHSKKDRLMVLDELPALGYLGFVDNALTLGAGYGMKIVGVFQSMEKVQTTYPNTWRTFMKSSLVIFISADADEAIYVSDRIHKTTINVESASSGESQQSNQGQIAQNTSQQSGTTQSSSERYLLTPSEISSLGKKIIVAFTAEECPPIVCRRINYWEEPHYQGKFDDNPLHKN